MTRVAVIRDPTNASGIGQFGAIQAVAPSFGVELQPDRRARRDEIERGITAFARGPNDGLIVTSSRLAMVHRDLIIALAARIGCPPSTACSVRPMGRSDFLRGRCSDRYGSAAGYVDRILKGEKPADLPVQATDQIRARHQSQDRQGARPRGAAVAARPR